LTLFRIALTLTAGVTRAGSGTKVADAAGVATGDCGATETRGSELIDVAAEGVAAVDDGNETARIALSCATGGADFVAGEKPGERPESAAALPTAGAGAAMRLCTLGPACETADFGAVTRGDELESGELEPAEGAPSSAAAMPGVTANATPTPAVTAPTWSHRSTGNVAESRFE
jgi:hypothetical protein